MSWADIEAKEKAKAITGIVFKFYESGAPRSQEMYVNGVLNGRSIIFRPDGTKLRETNYKAGIYDGDTILYSKSERPEQIWRFKAGTLIERIGFGENGVRNDGKKYREVGAVKAAEKTCSYRWINGDWVWGQHD